LKIFISNLCGIQLLLHNTYGQPKVKVKICLPSLKFMKRPRINFHADTMSSAQVVWALVKKSQNLLLKKVKKKSK